MKFLTSLTLSMICIGKDLISDETVPFEPLYAGTLLAFYPQNADPGRVSVQPFLFINTELGVYTDSWHLQHFKHKNEIEQLLLVVETGITKNFDIALGLTGFAAQSHGGNSWLYGDTRVYLGMQVTRDQKESWIPDIRFVFGESFPTGKYDHLNPQKNGSDIAGTGSYDTTILFVTRKIFYTFPKHPYNFNLNLFYIVSTTTRVRGFNAYGGGINTRGAVRPGDQFIANLGFECSLTRNWAIGTDIRYEHQNRSHFSGQLDRSGPLFGLLSLDRISLAPCLEYNWSQDFSVAGGVWFTIAGRNSEAFVNGIFNVYYYF